MKNLKFILSALVALFALSASASTINVPFYDFQGRLVTDVECPVCSPEYEGAPGDAYLVNGSVYFDTTETTIGFDWGFEVCTTTRTYLAFFYSTK